MSSFTVKLAVCMHKMYCA